MILSSDVACAFLAVDGLVEHTEQIERIALDARPTRRCDIGSTASRRSQRVRPSLFRLRGLVSLRARPK